MRSFKRSFDRSSFRALRHAACIPRLMGLITSSVCLAGASQSALAQTDVSSGVDTAAAAAVASAQLRATSVEIEKVDPSVDSPTSTTARLYRIDQTAQAPNSQELRTRVWWGSGVGSMGAGTDWAATPAGSSLRPLRPVVGVRANVSGETRVVYEVRGAATASTMATATALGATDKEARLALEFKSAKNPAQNLRNGLFRVQLSNTSALFLKPRSGGMVVSYRSQF